MGVPDKYAYGLKTCAYKVVLLDETGDVNINEWIVSNEYGESDPDTEHFVDIVVDKDMLMRLDRDSSDESDHIETIDISSDPNPCSNGSDNEIDLCSDIDFQFDLDDIMKLVKFCQFHISCVWQ